ncbi:hypothetical protein P3X46_014883 [Hevea brasiliensis]|uniref:Uncharacterized protein n=1 Tax=Hevea brasiliensis TaxID=3981 RepID=A0ABQ9LU52_HEVBR|nr:uncharacterized protein LOC110632116 [Hevea brasiliensis]XP_021635918.2 uncharacterized protein LOC110632116 [Hevea brasiliensis]XP_021635920.2 uncharacterized protein LOC110632116 [Hevea brasiliensis]XP_021635921.2 uncharacterized protein LOC110632116 [Hevea brasiliensis]XP_058008471.1 uncharacterized protein LOC110632116 [Hevea brasiliensis]KAJ9171525.1 hypothetical protein P3X46_014883 [Hevea brasiliensis]KAJ9171526.1 hypothetical protein P3X46_014883 [Hevea brasiliensis]KAJ9171527.1 h
MAVAEARAVWQRTANRCFVQEDAKRAPKLACCQSSSSSSKQVDGVPTNAADIPDNPAVGFMPLPRNSSYSNLSPDTRWWLQLQPSYGYQKGLTCDQLNALEAEMESLRAEIVNSPSKLGDVLPHDDRHSTCLDGNMNSESSFDAHCRISADRMINDPEVNNQEANTLYDKNDLEFIELKDTRENFKWMDMDPIECPQKSNEYCFDPESPWIGGAKNVPWWRTTDKDDLASLVAQKSLDYIENCDLPPPQKLCVRRYPCGRPVSSDQVHDCPNSETMKGRQKTAIEGQLQSSSEKLFSYTASHKDTTEIGQLPQGDPSKAQLLEALRHSQTRAREAEKVARQACAEKEHVIKLFFRQASQLFAYKQWFQLLQLETLYYQVKNGGQPMSTLFPVVLPWMPRKGRKLQKSWQKSTRSKRGKLGRPSHDISKYAVAFALGLSLVGAGLLLGWTVGWMLPL